MSEVLIIFFYKNILEYHFLSFSKEEHLINFTVHLLQRARLNLYFNI